jgi:hypothetical protein
MFCTACAKPLTEVPVIDVLVARYRCPDGHLFYRPREDWRKRIPNPSIVREPARAGDRALIEFWLTDIRARREMSDNLASVVRRLADLHTIDVQKQDDFWPKPVRFCFVCGEGVTVFEVDWETGHRCERGHRLWERGGHIHLHPPEVEVALDIEPQTFIAARRADSWIADSEHTTPYISPALRGAISRQRPKLGSTELPAGT